jgi:signal transduction histidine kinase
MMRKKTTRMSKGRRAVPETLPRLNPDEDEGTSRPTMTVPLSKHGRATSATITVISGARQGHVFELSKEESWIGRADDCEIAIDDQGISRRHAKLIRAGDKVFLRDNRAKNGTFVNGRRVSSEQELFPGDEIQIGSILSLVFTNATENAERLAQQRAAQEKSINERMYDERIESLANIVTRVAHEINTPLGVANTANAIVASLVEEVARTPPGPEFDLLLMDLQQSSTLITRSLERASRIVHTFKQLSARQLQDEHSACDLAVILRECLDSVSSETKRLGITIRTSWSGDNAFPWAGFPGHLSQVMNNLIQNIMRHAYTDRVGPVDVRISVEDDEYQLEVEDYGAGVPSEIFPRMFEPFVASGREQGGTGLGLAISHNIITNVLKGRISCESSDGNGTKFVIQIPRSVPRVSERP